MVKTHRILRVRSDLVGFIGGLTRGTHMARVVSRLRLEGLSLQLMGVSKISPAKVFRWKDCFCASEVALSLRSLFKLTWF